ncbi:MAG: VOC family protein, partial [Pseudomonadota bacterium]
EGEADAIMAAMPVRDLEAGIAFYVDTLGFQAIYKDDGGYAVLKLDGIELHLWLANDETWRTRDHSEPIVSGAESFIAGTHSCRIRVNGIENRWQKMHALECIHPNANLEKKPWGTTEFGVLDPYGNLIIFFEWL